MTYFEDALRSEDDPWALRDHWYEERKRALILAALPRRRFRNALEATRFAGILTPALAERCDQLLVADLFRTLRRDTREQLPAHVRITEIPVPLDWPASEVFDLVVIYELGHHLGPVDSEWLIARSVGSLSEDGVILAVHWRHPIEGRPMRGDEVHDQLREHPDLAVLATHEEADFLLDVLVRPPVVSVALAEDV
jgi:hypothetical protein